MTDKASIQTYKDYLKEQIKLAQPDIDPDELEDFEIAEYLTGWGFDEEKQAVEFEHLETIGGEGEGDHYEVVFRIKDKTFSVVGTWVSHDGIYWNDIWDWHEVKQVEVTRKEWKIV